MDIIHCISQLVWYLILFHKNVKCDSEVMMKSTGSTDSIKVSSLFTGKNEINFCSSFFLHIIFSTHIKQKKKSGTWHILQIAWHSVCDEASVENSKLTQPFKANGCIKATFIRNPLFLNISTWSVKIKGIKTYLKMWRNWMKIVPTENLHRDAALFPTKNFTLLLNNF